MTTERDSRTRIVLSWLREDAHEDAERVLLRALDEIDTTPQRRPIWPARRISNVNAYAKLAIAVAAVIVIAVAGLQFLPRNGSSVGGPAASPSPTIGPTPIPTLGSGPLAPGRYSMGRSGPSTSIQIPAGWSGDVSTNAMDVATHVDTSSERRWGRWTDSIKVFGDSCRSNGTLKPIVGSAQELVAALKAQNGTDATVTDVTVGGVHGKRVDVVRSPGLDPATCDDGAASPVKIWMDGAETGYYALGGDGRGIVEAFDVDGKLVVLTGVVGPDATSVDVAELETVIASTQFEP